LVSTTRAAPALWRAASLLLVFVLLAGCALLEQTSATITPSASASSSATASSGSASPSADPDADAAAVVDAFRAFIQTQRSFHLQADVKMTIAKQLIDMDLVADVTKGKEKDVIDVRGAGVSVHIQLIQIGRTVYIKLANRAWQKSAAKVSPSNPLAELDVKGLVPIDRVNVGAVLTHHLRVTDPKALATETIGAGTVSAVVYKTVAFDIYVTDDGVPLAAIFEFTATGAFQGKKQPVKGTVRYDFSKFDEPIKIEAPI
jgi:hypothetical protein